MSVWWNKAHTYFTEINTECVFVSARRAIEFVYFDQLTFNGMRTLLIRFRMNCRIKWVQSALCKMHWLNSICIYFSISVVLPFQRHFQWTASAIKVQKCLLLTQTLFSSSNVEPTTPIDIVDPGEKQLLIQYLMWSTFNDRLISIVKGGANCYVGIGHNTLLNSVKTF